MHQPTFPKISKNVIELFFLLFFLFALRTYTIISIKRYIDSLARILSIRMRYYTLYKWHFCRLLMFLCWEIKTFRLAFVSDKQYFLVAIIFCDLNVPSVAIYNTHSNTFIQQFLKIYINWNFILLLL